MAAIKMDWQKNLLLAAMAAVVIMLIIRWDKFQQETSEITNPTPVASIISAQDQALDIPEAIEAIKAQDKTTDITDNTQPSEKIIQVNTDTLQVYIDTHGGDIVKVGLPKHFAEIDTPDIPFTLIDNTLSQTYVVQSGLIGKNGTDTSSSRPTFTSTSNLYQLTEDADSINVDLMFEQNNISIIKRFVFYKGEYRVDLEYLIDNRTDIPWQANLYGQIKRDDVEPSTASGIGMKPFLGAALTTEDERYKKFTFDDLEEKSFKTQLTGGWVSMVQHYFISAWIPNPQTINHFHLRKLGQSNQYMMGFTSEATTVAAHSEGKITAQFYAGPKDTETLEKISPFLDLTVDYGFLWWMAKPLFILLKYIFSLVGNWGIAIILLTVSIKAIFYKLSATSYRSMARMRKLTPKMADLKERYGDDRQKLSQETMKLYKTEKVNPLGGCLPMLIQMPVFLALYWMLMESVELRHTAFLWMNDLSVKDPIFILPLLMGFTMWLTMRLSPAPPDPMQAKIMQFMPVGFTVMFLWFPAGLVLYWVTNNTLSFIQQRLITMQIDNADKKEA